MLSSLTSWQFVGGLTRAERTCSLEAALILSRRWQMANGRPDGLPVSNVHVVMSKKKKYVSVS